RRGGPAGGSDAPACREGRRARLRAGERGPAIHPRRDPGEYRGGGDSVIPAGGHAARGGRATAAWLRRQASAFGEASPEAVRRGVVQLVRCLPDRHVRALWQAASTEGLP